jgi:hypothetical protein
MSEKNLKTIFPPKVLRSPDCGLLPRVALPSVALLCAPCEKGRVAGRSAAEQPPCHSLTLRCAPAGAPSQAVAATVSHGDTAKSAAEQVGLGAFDKHVRSHHRTKKAEQH